MANCVVMRFHWRAVDAHTDRQRYQVLRLDDDKIRDMAEYRTVGEARRAAQRLTADGPSH